MDYFEDVADLEGLKALYKKLVFELHPDLGGDEELFKTMQAQYEKKLSWLGGTQKDFSNDRFSEVLLKIINFENLKIEIIGQWIWCFESKDYKDQLKELGFWFSASKKAWVFSGEKKRNHRSHNSVDDLRKKWGSEEVQTNKTVKLN